VLYKAISALTLPDRLNWLRVRGLPGSPPPGVKGGQEAWRGAGGNKKDVSYVSSPINCEEIAQFTERTS
jgi:hypothetical protein